MYYLFEIFYITDEADSGIREECDTVIAQEHLLLLHQLSILGYLDILISTLRIVLS